MIGKKINQLATELAPVSTDLTIIGDPDSGVSKKITLAQLGAIFSGAVSFYTDLASFPATGDINVIYCAKDTQKLYLWSGSAYTEVFPSQALLDTYQLRSEKGNANGYASLDSGGKVPISQLPSSIMEYKGTWNAFTNTPTLANGTGDTGDVYICNVAGTVNFGAGPLTFAVGDYVIYSGTIWQRSSGAVGTVTSVALTVGGDAISVSGSPLTTSGTLALAFSGTTSQYIRGNGTLANFPTSLVTGTGTINYITKWSGTSGELINGTLLDIGGTVYNSYANAGQFAWQFNGNTTTGQSYGALIVAGTNASDIALRIQNASSTSVYFYVWGDGKVQINNIPNATTDTDRFLVSDSGVIKYRTGAELLSDIGGASASGYVPYTGATANLDLGTHTLIAAKGTFSSSGSGDTVGITHSSGSGIALNITKGGNGEGLYINKTSGSGNAATIIGTLNATTLVKSGGTSSQFLKADGSVDSTSYGTGSVTSVGLSSATSGVTIGSTPITTSGTITLAIATASGSQQGLLSSTDWTTFNNKQNALTNPVTGTGTTNYLPKFTGASTIGDSQIFDNGTQVGIGTATPSYKLDVSGAIQTSVASGNGSLYINNSSLSGKFWTLIPETASGETNLLWYYGGAGASVKMNLTNTGNLGLGVVPSAWATIAPAFQVNSASFSSFDNSANVAANFFHNGTSDRYINNGFATLYQQYTGRHIWYNAPSGTAGNAISFTQAMTLDASGRLGINTTSPGSYSSPANQLVVGTNSGNNGITIAGGTTGLSSIYFADGTTGNEAFRGYIEYGHSSDALSFGTAASTRLTITNGGNVGIGTTAPTNTGGYATLTVGGATSTLGQITWNSGTTAIGYAYNDGNNMYIGSNSALIFATTSAATERMRITSGGTLLVGTTTTTGLTTGSSVNVGISLGGGVISSQVNNNSNQYWSKASGYTSGDFTAHFVNNTYVGGISTNGSSTTYATASDYRLKSDFKDFNGLDLVAKIKTYDYEYKSDKSRSYGVIAHELQSIINYAVTGVKDGEQMQGVDYSKIVPVLIKAIQEQQLQIEQLKNK